MVVAALALLTFWQGEDAWRCAGWLLLTLGAGIVVFVRIWLGALRTHGASRALRDSAGLVALFILGTVAGSWLRKADLKPTKERVEMLAAAIAEHQRTHGSLPESLSAVEAALPQSSRKVYKITYQPRADGTYALFFQPAWYRHEYSAATRTWKMRD